MTGEAILLRTDAFDADLAAFADRLAGESGRALLVLADESRAPLPVPARFRTLAVEPGRLGLLETPDMMWRCGDYFLYAALEALPGVERFWLVEPDVRIHAPNLRPLFDGSGAADAADLVTGWHVPASPNWGWFPMMRPHAPDVRICMLQLCRLSRRALAHLYAARLALGARFRAEGLALADWPNDEGFVASTLAAGGFSVATLARHAPDFFTTGTFTFTRPTSLLWLRDQPFDGRIYHPVVTGEKFFKRANIFLRRLVATEQDPEPVARELAAGLREQIVRELRATPAGGPHRAALAALCGDAAPAPGGR